jgi:hypothetical protein
MSKNPAPRWRLLRKRRLSQSIGDGLSVRAVSAAVIKL